jgi:CRISPR-associated endonuclease Cas1
MLYDTIHDESPAAILDAVFNREATTDQVVIAHGYGIQIRVKDSHLIIKDGIGDSQRERRYPKADRTLQRIVITGQTGYVSLESLRWLSEHGISLVTLDLNCELVSQYVTNDTQWDTSIFRAQVLADGTTLALEIAREIESRKLRGQAATIARLFNDANIEARICQYAALLEAAPTVSDVMGIEGKAAVDYFRAWRSLSVQWDGKSVSRVPVHWLSFDGRSSRIKYRSTKYGATDPINALLNYAYTLGYAECRAACIANGLDPRIGFVHSDRLGRDSLACDVLEMIRSHIDAYVISLVRSRVFTAKDFCEPYGYDPGTCRIVAPLTHEIAEKSYEWHDHANEAARLVSQLLTGGTVSNARSEERQRNINEYVSVDDVLPVKQWTEIQSILPAASRLSTGGRPGTPDRMVIAAMVHCETHARPWAQTPTSLGATHRVLRKRKSEWRKSGHWPAIEAEIQRLASSR